MNLFSINRLDLIIKYLYFKKVLLEKHPNSKFYEEMYMRHIMGRNGCNEIGNLNKNSPADFLRESKKLFDSMKNEGFCTSTLPIIGKLNGGLYEGAHRIACAEALNIRPKVEIRDRKWRTWKMEEILGSIGKENDLIIFYYWCMLNINSLAFMILYEPALKRQDFLKNWVKNNNMSIVRNELMAFNNYDILYDIYGYEWRERTQSNIQRKINLLKKNNMKYYKVLVIKGGEECFKKLNANKLYFRKNMSAGVKVDDYITLHDANSKKELFLLLNLFFTPLSRKVNKMRKRREYESKLDDYLYDLSKILKKHKIKREDICIVGSSPLDVIGLRPTTDIDIVINKEDRKRFGEKSVSLGPFCDIVNNNYTKSNITDNLLIYDNTYHFYYRGFKFVDPKIVYERKLKDKRPKDLKDVKLLEEKYRKMAI